MYDGLLSPSEIEIRLLISHTKRDPVYQSSSFLQESFMTLDEVVPTSDKRFYDDLASIDQAEARLGIKLPSGYREYITRFGEGILGGYIRVYPPHQLLDGDNSVTEWRARIREYWFWDEGEQLLTKEKALECHIVADTIEGDEIVAHPSNPDQLYVLPRYEEQSYIAGEGLLATLEWLLSSGVLTEPIDDRSFDPFDGKNLDAEE